MDTKPKKEKLVVILQESLLASIIKDVLAFGMFGGLMYFNHRVLSGNGWIDFVFILIVLMYTASKNLSTVYSGPKDGAIKWLQDKE